MSGVDPRYGTSPSPRVVNDGSPIPKGGGTYKIGVPYQIAGRWYAPRAEPDYDRAGIASWYGDDFHGRKTANGELYDMRALSAAHPTLPMPSYVWVTNLASRRTLLVRVNDRGPYAHDRLIDLSRASARALGFAGKGLAHVRVRYAGPAPLNGDDRREQAYLRTQPWNDGSPETTAGQSLVKSRSLADAGVWRMGGRRLDGERSWQPTAATASIEPRPLLEDAEILGSARASLGHAGAGDPDSTAAIVAGQFRDRANAEQRVAALRLFGHFRVFALPGRRDATYEVRSDPVSDAAAMQLAGELRRAGFTDVRLEMDRQ